MVEVAAQVNLSVTVSLGEPDLVLVEVEFPGAKAGQAGDFAGLVFAAVVFLT